MKLGEDIIVLPSVNSTNIYAMAEVHAHMAKHGMVYFALEQTAGKGQRGKQWLSAIGENIMMSAVFSMGSRSPDQQFPFSAAVALGCYDFYKSYAGDEVSIKWPNDIYWRDRKAGGILIENLIQGGGWTWAVAGIGLNINQAKFDPAISRTPVSLLQITGRQSDLMEMTRKLCVFLENRWQQFLVRPDTLVEDYNQVLFQCGERVRLKKDNRVFEAKLLKVDPSGRLVVLTSIEEQFYHGEIEFV